MKRTCSMCHDGFTVVVEGKTVPCPAHVADIKNAIRTVILTTSGSLEESKEQLKLIDLGNDRPGGKWYSREEWLARNESVGRNALLTLVLEETQLYHDVNGYTDEPGRMAKVITALTENLERIGVYYELGYAWSMHFYANTPAPDFAPDEEAAAGGSHLTELAKVYTAAVPWSPKEGTHVETVPPFAFDEVSRRAAELRAKVVAGETLSTDEWAVLVLQNLHDTLYPVDDPDEQWEVETIEYVAGALNQCETGLTIGDCPNCDQKNVLLRDALSGAKSACETCCNDPDLAMRVDEKEEES